MLNKNRTSRIPWLDFVFWNSLNLYFDPGGLFSGLNGGKIFGPLRFQDLWIVVLLGCFIVSSQKSITLIKNTKMLTSFKRELSVYYVYFFIVFGALMPVFYSDLDYSIFLVKNRYMFYALIIFFSTYHFSFRSLPLFYKTTLFWGLISLTCYFLTIVLGFNVLPVIEIERYKGSGMIRYVMYNYGLFDLLLPIWMTYLFCQFKRKPPYSRFFSIFGVLMLFTLLVTLTRRVMLDVAFSFFCSYFIVNYLNKFKLKSGLRVFAIAMFLVLLIGIAKPSYLSNISTVFTDAFSLALTGEDTQGRTDYRVSGDGDLGHVKSAISESILFGYGYTDIQFNGEFNAARCPRGNYWAMMYDAATEVPIYFCFFGFGVFGAYFIFLLYRRIFIVLKRLFALYRSYSTSLTDIERYIILGLILFFAKSFSINIPNLGKLFWNLSFDKGAVPLALFFALYTKLLSIRKLNSTSKL